MDVSREAIPCASFFLGGVVGSGVRVPTLAHIASTGALPNRPAHVTHVRTYLR